MKKRRILMRTLLTMRLHWIYAFLIHIFSIDKIYTTCYSITIVYLVSLKNYLQTNIAKAIIYAEFSIITINPKVITIRQDFFGCVLKCACFIHPQMLQYIYDYVIHSLPDCEVIFITIKNNLKYLRLCPG